MERNGYGNRGILKINTIVDEIEQKTCSKLGDVIIIVTG